MEQLWIILFPLSFTEATPSTPTHCLCTTQANSEADNHIITVTVTPTDTVVCTETEMNKDAKTVIVVVTSTSVVPCQQESGLADQNSDCNGSQAVWVVMTILFLVIAVSAIVSSTFLGYLLHKKVKSQGNANAAASGTDTNTSIRKGTISRKCKVTGK